MIRAEHLSVIYGQAKDNLLPAVKELSFTVWECEIVGFIGVNGAGKSSTIRALVGFQPLASGVADLFDRPVPDAGSRESVGFLPETALYSPFLTPYETLYLYGELSGMGGNGSRERAFDLLRRVGLAEKRKVLIM